MKKHKSSKTGIANSRNVVVVTLCFSGILLAVAAFGGQRAARTAKKESTIQTTPETTIVIGAKSSVSVPSTPSAPNAPTPPSGTLSPGNPTITYTDGPLIPNTTGLLGPPICSAPGLCSDFQLTVMAASVAATKQIYI